MSFSPHELKLLHALQNDSDRSVGALAEDSGLAQSTAWRKIQEMQAAGIIQKHVALLDPAKLSLKLCVFANIKLRDHTPEAVTAFSNMVNRHPEIMECYSVSGTSDYVLKLRVRDVEAYEEFMSHNLLRSPFVRSVVSSFALKEIKNTTELPL